MHWPFLDTETTGLPDSDGVPRQSKLLEVGLAIVSIPTFEVVDTRSWTYHYNLLNSGQRDRYIWGGGQDIYIHPNVVDMHRKNGLWESCKRSQLVDYQKMDELIQRYLVDNGCQGMPLCGANPAFDRAFLRVFLPGTQNLLHYRSLETNSFWLLQSAITGEDPKREKPASHRAVDDCKDAVAVIEKHFEFMKDFWEKVG